MANFKPTGHIRLAGALALAIAGGWLTPTLAASSDTWDRLAQCESGQRWNINTGNGYYGGLQFSAATWSAYGGEQFAPKAHRATRAEQITVAERLLADRGWGPWPSCSTKLGLTAADAGGPFAAAERKAANTAARLVKKQAQLDDLQARHARAIRNLRHAPAAEIDARTQKIARLKAWAERKVAAVATARADADRAARKLQAARIASGIAPPGA
jgi:resuscitation-promoting factor RpfA